MRYTVVFEIHVETDNKEEAMRKVLELARAGKFDKVEAFRKKSIEELLSSEFGQEWVDWRGLLREEDLF